MHKTVVLNVVGLSPSLLGPHTPRLSEYAARGGCAAISPVLPAVTCSVQSTYVTGLYPDSHGIVGNGWYFRDECEVKFWRQSNKLVAGQKVWETARQRDPSFTCANHFWWYNMYSSVDYSITPRPMYPADGRKLPDVYTHPASLRSDLQAELGTFPLFNFWGPNTSIRASQWIAEAAKRVDRLHDPTLTLIYLPHLDYCLQKHGAGPEKVAGDLREIDTVCGDLLDYYEAMGAQVLILSEYGIEDVSRPVHINRVLREHGLLAVREELGRELLDAGASEAFAVADHQLAHVYIRDPSRTEEVRALLGSLPGVEQVLDDAGKREHRLDHPRSGDLVAIAEPGAWFTYYYWLQDDRAPDFARTVDIHRKPGYDPVELFMDPRLRAPKAKVGWTLLRKQLGFRYLMDVIPLDASLVKGSHGRLPSTAAQGPLLITPDAGMLHAPVVQADTVADLILRHLERPHRS
ncbi:MAG: alkaline phosphatase family protein [Chloroflexota bacterium]|nr:alkaline phosphatase family protein [Chloroflexota bacterium]